MEGDSRGQSLCGVVGQCVSVDQDDLRCVERAGAGGYVIHPMVGGRGALRDCGRRVVVDFQVSVVAAEKNFEMAFGGHGALPDLCSIHLFLLCLDLRERKLMRIVDGDGKLLVAVVGTLVWERFVELAFVGGVMPRCRGGRTGGLCAIRSFGECTFGSDFDVGGYPLWGVGGAVFRQSEADYGDENRDRIFLILGWAGTLYDWVASD